MSESNGIQPGELRDRSGRLLGTFVTVEEAARAEAEMNELKATLARTIKEKEFYERLLGQAEAARLAAPITREEITDLHQNGFTAAQLREEIERQFVGGRCKLAS